MKRLLKFSFVLILFLLFPICIVGAKLNTCININGYWSQWEERNLSCQMQYDNTTHTFSGFVFYTNNQPWNYFFKVDVNNFIKIDKKSIKFHLKNNSWYQYEGTVEYYVSDLLPNIETVLKSRGFPLIYPGCHGPLSKANYVKRTAKAIIKIEPFKKEPSTFNIIFNNIGIGIEFITLPFPKEYFIK